MVVPSSSTSWFIDYHNYWVSWDKMRITLQRHDIVPIWYFCYWSLRYTQYSRDIVMLGLITSIKTGLLIWKHHLHILMDLHRKHHFHIFFKAFLTVEQLLLLLALGVLLPGAIWGMVKDGIVSVSPWAAWLFTSTGQGLFGVKTVLVKAGASSNFCVPGKSCNNINGCLWLMCPVMI